MKTLITILALSFAVQAQAQGFKNLNALRDLISISDELVVQADLVSRVAREEGNKREASICYALGTLASSRARLAQKASSLDSYSSRQVLMALGTINSSALAMEDLCNERASLSTSLMPSLGRDGRDAKKSSSFDDDMRRRIAAQIQQQAGSIAQIIQSAINN